jgi:hypothetical protein
MAMAGILALFVLLAGLLFTIGDDGSDIGDPPDSL